MLVKLFVVASRLSRRRRRSISMLNISIKVYICIIYICIIYTCLYIYYVVDTRGRIRGAVEGGEGGHERGGMRGDVEGSVTVSPHFHCDTYRAALRHAPMFQNKFLFEAFYVWILSCRYVSESKQVFV